MSAADPLDLVAARALELVQDGMVVGLGTGRAASAFVRALGMRVAAGLRVRGIPTSVATTELAAAAGIPLVTLDDVDVIDLVVDGADEVVRLAHRVDAFQLFHSGPMIKTSRSMSISGRTNVMSGTLCAFVSLWLGSDVLVTGIPANPRGPAPRARFRSIVSRLSLAVWPSAITLHFSLRATRSRCW